MASSAAIFLRPRNAFYPDTDGLPMAENTFQYEWIVTIKGGLDDVFADNPDVFVAGDLFWYPVEGHPEIRAAPDVMVAFGAPKGHRLSYLQWEEGGVPPQVVFEALSPGNRAGEMARKFEFYRSYGVEEYYIFDPGPKRLEFTGYLRQGDNLVEVATANGHVSPRLGVRFELADQDFRIFRPDGQRFLTFEQWRHRAAQERQVAERERLRADQERQKADQALAEVEQLRRRLRAMGESLDD